VRVPTFKLWKKTTTAHIKNILHVDVLYNIKRKKYKRLCRIGIRQVTFDRMVIILYRSCKIFLYLLCNWIIAISRGEHANHYATDAVPYFHFIFINFFNQFFFIVLQYIIWKQKLIQNNKKIGICCFSAKNASLRGKSKDWLTRNQNNVSEWSDISTLRCFLLNCTAFGWGVSEETIKMWKVNRWKTTDDGRQVMAKAHIAFGKVRSSVTVTHFVPIR
jgi:hypothetical protein